MDTYVKALLKTSIIFGLLILFFYILITKPLLALLIIGVLASIVLFVSIFALVLENDS